MTPVILDTVTLRHEIDLAEAKRCAPKMFELSCEAFAGMALELLAWRGQFGMMVFNPETNKIEVAK